MLEILPPVCRRSLAVKWKGKKQRAEALIFFSLFDWGIFNMDQYIADCTNIRRKYSFSSRFQLHRHFFPPKIWIPFWLERSIFITVLFFMISLCSSLGFPALSCWLTLIPFSFSFCLDLPACAFLLSASAPPPFFFLSCYEKWSVMQWR